MKRTTNDNRKKIRSNRRKLDNNDPNMWRPWAALDREILLMVLMKIGLIDFLSFSGVCRSWRSRALSHRDTFMAGKEPLMVIKSPHAMKAISLLDVFNRGRRYKTLLPDVSGQSCVGLSCGYLIMLRRNYGELSIINPITRHELHFPAISLQLLPPTDYLRAIVVYSSSSSKFRMIVLGEDFKSLLLSKSGGSEWVIFRYSNKVWEIVDLTFFKGKIYVLNQNGSLGELRLKPEISLKLLNVKGIIPSSKMVCLQLVTSSECLFMVVSGRVIVQYELDFEKMKWIPRKDLGGNALFLSDIKCSAVVNTSCWREAHRNSTYYLDRGSWNGRGSPLIVLASDVEDDFWDQPHGLGFIPYSWNSKSLAPNVQGDLWYFPDECYKINMLAEEA